MINQRCAAAQHVSGRDGRSLGDIWTWALNVKIIVSTKAWMTCGRRDGERNGEPS